MAQDVNNPCGSVYIAMINPATPVSLIFMKKSRQRRG
jgi:hypothetical protein